MAGALQAVYSSLPGRDFIPDVQQEQAIEAMGNALMNGKNKGYFEMATSTGKTMVEVVTAEASWRAGQRCHIFAPTIEIADQIYGADGNTGFGRFTELLNQPGVVQRNYGKHRAKPNAGIVISTYPGANAEMDNPRLGIFGTLIADECHRSLGPKTSHTMLNYMPGAHRYGFSATPDYAEDRKSEEVYGERLFEFALRTAIEADKTAPVRALLYETKRRLFLSDKQRNFTEGELAPLIDDIDRNGIAVKMARDLVADGRQGIIACVSGDDNIHARLMAGILSNTRLEGKNGKDGRLVVAEDIGSHLTPEEQKRRLRDYKNGKIDILTFTKTLEEGWDSDRASFCINLSPTASQVRIKQLLGRILRKKKDGKEGIFIDFVDEKFGLAKQQYTALHALEIEDIDIHRVLGKAGSSGSRGPQPGKRLKNLAEIFEPALFERLMNSHGKLLQDVLIKALENPTDPLVAEWERILNREKPPLPTELPENPVATVGIARALAYLARKHRKATGFLPNYKERLAAAAGSLGKDVLTWHGVQVPWDEALPRIEPRRQHNLDNVFDPETYIGYLELRGNLRRAIASLDQRTAGVLQLFHGLTEDGQKRTLDEIKVVYGISRERVRQILRSAYSDLNNSSHAALLGPHWRPDYEPPARHVPDQEPADNTPGIFEQITVPIFDAEDDRPYLDRLHEACHAWLAQQRSIEHQADELGVLQLAAADLTPAFIQIHGQQIRDPEQAIQHFTAATKHLNDLGSIISEHAGSTTVRELVDQGVLSLYDVRVAFNLHHPRAKVTLASEVLDYPVASMQTILRRNQIAYRRHLGALRTTPRAFWHLHDKGMRHGYPKNMLIPLATFRIHRDLIQRQRQLLVTKQRINHRPYPDTDGGRASKQASLLVIDTQLLHVARRLTSIKNDIEKGYVEDGYVML
jgi:superfamily II DNA or RNA helicase